MVEIKVFCRFFNIDLQEAEKLAAIAESITEMVKSISSSLRSIFGDSIPDVGRKRKWGPLAITERIRTKLSKFEQKAPIVERAMNSFERLFNSIEKIDDEFQRKNAAKQQTRTAPLNQDMQRMEAK